MSQPPRKPVPGNDPACSALMKAIETFFDDTILSPGHKLRNKVDQLHGLLEGYGVYVPAPGTEWAEEPVGVLAWGGAAGMIQPPSEPAPSERVTPMAK